MFATSTVGTGSQYRGDERVLRQYTVRRLLVVLRGTAAKYTTSSII